jgi:hypothetical protein
MVLAYDGHPLVSSCFTMGNAHYWQWFKLMMDILLVSSCFTMGNAHYWQWFKLMMDILWCHHALQWVMPTIGAHFGKFY